jgi:tRNA (guanine37-N1)-methyltransferase
LAPPVYTRPAEFRGEKVPEILLSGDPKKVENWRYEMSVERTRQRRPDLLEGE